MRSSTLQQIQNLHSMLKCRLEFCWILLFAIDVADVWSIKTMRRWTSGDERICRWMRNTCALVNDMIHSNFIITIFVWVVFFYYFIIPISCNFQVTTCNKQFVCFNSGKCLSFENDFFKAFVSQKKNFSKIIVKKS